MTFATIAGTWCAPSAAVVPESGFYWMPGRSGEGLFVDRQGPVVSVTVFTNSLDGRPVFYTSAGFLQEGGWIEELRYTEGLYPLHSFTSTLYRHSDGPMFGHGHIRETGDGVSNAERVGDITFTFPFNMTVDYVVQFDESSPSEGIPSRGQGIAQAFVYGYDGIGTNLILDNTACWTSLAGEWIFASMGPGPELLARFTFGPPSVEGETTCPVLSNSLVTYADPDRGAVLRCVWSAHQDPVFLRTVVPGCQLFQNEQPLLWFSHPDIGVRTIIGTQGLIPSYSEDSYPLRGVERVKGMRLE